MTISQPYHHMRLLHTSLGVEYIAATFNANTRKAIHIIAMYIIFVNVQNSPSKVFGSNANFLSHDNN